MRTSALSVQSTCSGCESQTAVLNEANTADEREHVNEAGDIECFYNSINISNRGAF